MGASRSRQTSFPRPVESLRQYAFVADGERGALIGARGELAWLCFPRWDSPAVFAGLLDGGGGYEVRPGGRASWGGMYRDRSLEWRSRWVTADGELECAEALAAPGRPDRMVLLRRLSGLAGEVAALVRLDLRAGFGRRGVRQLRRDGNVFRGRVGDLWFSWCGPPRCRVEDSGRHPALTATVPLRSGDQHDLVLVLGLTEEAAEPVDADECWRGTRAYWRDRIAPDPPGTYAWRDAQHGRAVLAGLTSAAGGTVAAATMSLPERAEQSRDYDYRYAWIRDQCYIGQAAAAAGDAVLLDSSVRFVAERLLEHGPALAPAYRVGGGPVPGEQRLSLAGYPGGSVVQGNRVESQFQLDAFGEALLLFAATERAGRLDDDGWHAAEVAAAAIERRHGDPDAGIWEIEPRHWTHSRLTCAAGLRAAAAGGRAGRSAADWVALADRLVVAAGTEAVHATGRWQRAPDDPRVDAALLFPALRGAVPQDDPRSEATRRAIVAELTDDGYAYRFRHDERPLDDAEGAFLLCGFAMALTCEQIGDHAAALAWFERNRSSCGTAALLTEEYDVRQRQPRGNLPQAFVHALLVEGAHTLS